MSALHILNGDSTRDTFVQTGIRGDVLVWREVLSEGPLIEDIHSRDFWVARSQWIGQTFNAPSPEYQSSVVNELDLIRENIHFDEITIWCEFDLHCQVNLLGTLKLLSNIDPDITPVYLVCPDAFPGVDHFMGIGQLNATQLKSLLSQKIRLNANDFALANEAWKIYVPQDAGILQSWLNQIQDFGNLPLLKPAMHAQVSRLSITDEGLSGIENKLLHIYNSGFETKVGMYTEFWRTEAIYGMGDAEIDIYLKRLIARKRIEVEL